MDRKSIVVKIDVDTWKKIRMIAIEKEIPVYTLVSKWVKEKTIDEKTKTGEIEKWQKSNG